MTNPTDTYVDLYIIHDHPPSSFYETNDILMLKIVETLIIRKR
jgi:hypothetical protein